MCCPDAYDSTVETLNVIKHFADLYHQRWRIEEVFKRLKHRLNLEDVSGL